MKEQMGLTLMNQRLDSSIDTRLSTKHIYRNWCMPQYSIPAHATALSLHLRGPEDGNRALLLVRERRPRLYLQSDVVDIAGVANGIEDGLHLAVPS